MVESMKLVRMEELDLIDHPATNILIKTFPLKEKY